MYPFWTTYFFWGFVGYALLLAFLGSVIAAKRAHSRLLGFTAGAIGGLGSYLLLRYRTSFLQRRNQHTRDWAWSTLRVLYLVSAAGLLVLGAAEMLWVGSLAVAGPSQELLRLAQRPPSWFQVFGYGTLGCVILLWMGSIFALTRRTPESERSDWLGVVILWSFIGAYWWLSRVETPRPPITMV
jgi:surface polysaccharide O-acyltransferase-like enzyme